MDKIKDALLVNKAVLKNTFKSIRYLPILAIVVFIINIIFSHLSNFLSITFNGGINGFVASLVSYLFEMIKYSLIISLLFNIINGDKINIGTIKDGFTTYVNPLMNLFFIFYIIQLIMSALRLPTIAFYLLYIFQSPMLETIYIGQVTGMDGIQSIFEFIKENWLSWFIVNLIFSAIILRSDSILGIIGIFGLLPNLISLSLIYSILVSIIYIYKGFLYKKLYRSSFRKRQFQGYDND